MWPDGRNPIGQRVVLNAAARARDGSGRTRRRRADVRTRQLMTAQAYAPMDQNPPYGSVQFAVKTAGDPAAPASAVRAMFEQHYPTLPSYNVRPWRRSWPAYVAERRFGMAAMSLFASSRWCWRVVGLFGLLAHLVEQRRARSASGWPRRRRRPSQARRRAQRRPPRNCRRAARTARRRWLARTIAAWSKGAEPSTPCRWPESTLDDAGVAAVAAFVAGPPRHPRRSASGPPRRVGRGICRFRISDC